jgi:tetratricopeptide (TPR) repeat protein/tRNA A-37 threonylcarbamoyl transferase component Bud32
MGSVWLAERADGTLKRRVALKLPRMVWARDLAARMARERDILGSLEHPNIARLYDAGVDQLGRPFLALEYVEGQRIDRFCDEQLLSVHARVRLFIQVLDAAQYAHVNLVLHRDLKPGNVLVNQRGEVRLLDFGIAKLMGDDEQVSQIDPNSRTLARAMTPRYASPEQVQHQRLTLASDVYSLGVMLYELLVGSAPYVTHNASRAELETAILESRIKTPSRAKVEPPVAECRAATASRLSQILRGDLDAVLLKAMARSVSERYPSVEAFRLDLVRWLEGHPVLAKPPSRLVAIKKFVARNVAAVSVVGLAASAVIISAIIAILQAHEARVESRRAAATRDFLIGLFEKANPELHGGRDVSARELLTLGGLSLSDSFETESDIAAEIALAIGNSWARLGDNENQLRMAELRSKLLSTQRDKKSYAKALIAEAQAASVLLKRERVDSALQALESLRNFESLDDKYKSDFFWLKAWSAHKSKKFVEAETMFLLAEKLAKDKNDLARTIRAIYGRMIVRLSQGNSKDGLAFYRQATALLERSEIPEEERIRRLFELNAALFDAGLYKPGWASINNLLRRSESFFGGLSTAHMYLYIFWLNWAIRVEELDAARQFIDRLKTTTNVVRNEASSLSSELIIAEAQLEIASGNYDTARVLSRNLRTDETQMRYWPAMEFVEAEALLRLGKLKPAMEIVNTHTWRSSAKNKKVDSTENSLFILWFRGAALEVLGESTEAKKTLETAMNLANKFYSSAHPITARLTYAYLLSVLNEGQDLVPQAALLSMSKSARETLSVAYPEKSAFLRSASILEQEIKKQPEYRDRKVLRMLGREAAFL